MTVKEILFTILAAAVMNNPVFTQFLGISSCREGRKYTGPAVILVMLITAAICAPLSAALESFGLAAFSTLAFALVILAVCFILQALCGKALGLSFPLTALNSAVLGLAVNNASASLGFAASLLTALGTGLGFWLALTVMSSLQLKLNNPDVPRAFRGLPLDILAAGIISMAVMAF